MKPPRTVLPLPRYCRRKPSKNGQWGYFFELPTWARKQDCPLEAEPLGEDYAVAVERAENILLPAYDSWLSGGCPTWSEFARYPAPSIGLLVSSRHIRNGKRSTTVGGWAVIPFRSRRANWSIWRRS